VSCSLLSCGRRWRVRVSAFVFSRYPLYTFRPHGDMGGTSQKFRLSFVTNSCTVCNLSWRWWWSAEIMGQFNPKLPYLTTPLSEISRVTHPPCLFTRLPLVFFQATRQPSQDLPPASLACARSKRECVQTPDLQTCGRCFGQPLHVVHFCLIPAHATIPLHFSCIMQTVLT
jgi:hypothetical protein